MDAARGVALLGMVAVHVVDPTTAAGDPHPVFLGFAGRASVLFVLLAGVGLALSTGGTRPAEGARRAVLRRRIARRAGLLFVVGLACGALGTPVAVILCHYALLFLLALPLLGLRAPALGAIAGAWLVLGPVAVFAASTAGQALLGRDEFLLGARLWLSPMPEDLLTPGVLLADLVVTGYYPVLSWGAFLVLGLALGRLPLDRARVATALLAAGALAWGAAAAAGAAVLRAPGVLERIAAGTGADPEQLTATLRTGEHRLAYLPPDPLWLALPTPHGGSPVAALLAAGWACAVLGLCLLVGAALDRALARRTPADRGAGAVVAGLVRAASRPLTGAGRIPLTLYVGHLLVLAAASRLEIDASDAALLTVLVALCLAAGLAADLTGRRGPLESAVARLSRAGEADAPSPVGR
ncbi:heparan-alpha-glucosaminide N-acetyltransferase domain-containing protein [Micrococcus endophyticus]|uniref:heparan-alpha-glucosaminide N-acetyltransferase domain-containing protein n=1 Tax=Micrococcus endophyticus TaxID=455343 RepID=UPI0034CEABC6